MKGQKGKACCEYEAAVGWLASCTVQHNGPATAGENRVALDLEGGSALRALALLFPSPHGDAYIASLRGVIRMRLRASRLRFCDVKFSGVSRHVT